MISCFLHHVWRLLGRFFLGNQGEIDGGWEKGSTFNGAHMEFLATQMKRLCLFFDVTGPRKKDWARQNIIASHRSLSACSVAMSSPSQRTLNDVMLLQVLAF